ncbi:sensor histidine kinase [Cryptosporangium aurantiacum]|uniref:histidine kinase n=1 Tax=Cryptosporangium aurantiacum TaxID=134849 RepID=A0A1M7NSZ0_9ACTN|nr:ATP-binding protein [Cryptosporangium aurantiacum]SHN06619.1 Signal transduction histidine kinase [Cryptosporangium aurantiacum]
MTGSARRRVTLRARLTLLYGGLFLVAGLVLLGTTYVLFNQQLAGWRTQVLISKTAPTPLASSSSSASPSVAPVVTTSQQNDVLRSVEDERRRLREAATNSLLTQGGIALGAVGLAAGALGWLIAGRVLAPLYQVTDTARRIASAPAAGSGLHERIPLRGPDDEVRELAATFNTMLERLDRSFDGQRRFVANASHELRTPLTVGRALVELAMKRKTASADTRRLGEDLLQINARHERLITGLLLMATSENELTERRPVDLADVAAHVLAQAGPDARAAGVTLQDELGEAVTLGDAQMLERIVHNLVENGIRYNVEGGWVRVVTRIGDGGSPEVVVTNTGPVVPPHDVPVLFDAFHRLPDQRSVTAAGVGLGLSIVRAVATTHGGRASAVARDGGGLVVTVALPPASI